MIVVHKDPVQSNRLLGDTLYERYTKGGADGLERVSEVIAIIESGEIAHVTLDSVYLVFLERLQESSKTQKNSVSLQLQRDLQAYYENLFNACELDFSTYI